MVQLRQFMQFATGSSAVIYCELHNNRPKTAETSAIRVS
jgi:hypothetical protein